MNKRQLLQKIKKEFPELKRYHARHNTEGWDHYVLILDNKYVFRFPRKKEYARKLYGEVALLKYLSGHKLPIPVPKYEFTAKDKSFAGYAILQGSQMTKEYFRTIGKPARYAIAQQLGSFLSILHKTPLGIARKFQPDIIHSQKQYKKLIQDLKKYVRLRLSKKENALTDEFLEEFAKYLKIPHNCLIHRDIHPYHLIVSKDKKKLSGIIDFADRSIGDPAMDFAELWTFGGKFVEEVYKNYSGPKDANFLHRSILYCKRVPLLMMVSPLKGGQGNFKRSHQHFKDIFIKNPLA